MNTIERTIRLPRLAALLLALVAATGCATSGTAGGAGADTDLIEEGAIGITVNNNLVPPTTMTVYIVSETGTRRRLGSVSPSRTSTFSYTPTMVTGQFRLFADLDAGGNRVSNPFTLTDATSSLTWNMQANLISFQ